MKPVNKQLFLIKVTPIAKAIGRETLTYFASEDLSVGTIVSAPIRKKIIKAVVVETSPATDAKTELRRASFAIKKLSRGSTRGNMPEGFIKTANQIAGGIGSTTGAVLNACLAPTLLEKMSQSRILKKNHGSPNRPEAEKFVIQADDNERISHYRSLIREEFAKGSSVFLALPSGHEAETMFSVLSKGIEDFTFLLHPGITKKKVGETWDKIRLEKHPVLVIATANFLPLPRTDLGTIIFENENSRSYLTQSRPYIDLRLLGEQFAKQIKARFLLGASVLRIETIWRTKEGELVEYVPLKFRSLSTVKGLLISQKRKDSDSQSAFSPISEELKKLIQDCRNNNERLFIFAARKGLAPQTACNDCGTIVMCERCSAPAVLYNSPKKNFFLCHRCGLKREADFTCKNCGGWRLKPLGIGIDRLATEITGLFPDLPIFQISGEKTKTTKQATDVAKKFYASGGGLLLGTELALSYLKEPVENSAIGAVDSLFSIPDFRIEERVFSILLKVKSLATTRFLIQTRSPENKVFNYVLSGNLLDFYRDEIESRKKFFYPPFSVLIKLSLAGNRQAVLAQMKEFEIDFADYSPVVFPAFINVIKGRYIMNALIRISRVGWPDQKLLNRLFELSPSWKVAINPENLI